MFSTDSPVPVLIVDDSANKRLALKAALAPLDVEVVEADSGLGALRQVMRRDFAVILLDVRMPGMSGVETAALIRQRVQSETTPIIFITASAANEVEISDVYAKGAVDIIFAPVPPQELRGKVSVFAGLFVRAKELAARARLVEETMAAACDAADEASRMKSTFLANMSHEIRTPMNGVLGMIELLLGTGLDDVQRDYAQTVQASGNALLTIIDDILDFSKVEAGMLGIEDAPFEVRTVLEDVIGLLRPQAHAKGLQLTSEVDPGCAEVVTGDAGRVRQVLLNLIGNAIKFTRSGEVAARVTAGECFEGRGEIRFDVSDTGEGVQPDKLDTIFEPFVQADASARRHHGGTGLGLAITSQLVELMGGACHVSSELGVGSTFSFTIRVGGHGARRAPGKPSPAHSPAPDLAGTNTGRILLAEDNPINQKVAVAMLESAGYVVDTALNGTEAVQAVADRRYDAVLMDCQMPGLNGYEATAAIRTREGAGRRTPIIAMTASARSEDRQRCLSGGMDNYLSKPVGREALLEAVSRAAQLAA